MTQSAVVTGLLQRRGVRQFVKFCLIGFTSMIIDVTISNYLTNHLAWNWILAQTISFTFAVTNGFIWNSLWTFKGLGSGRRHEMYLKFIGVNVIGLGLSIAIMDSIIIFSHYLLTHEFVFHLNDNPPVAVWRIAKFTAIVCVSIWNFLANKFWTFK